MRVAIPGDYFDTLRTLACFEKLAGHDVTVWTDHTDDADVLAERLQDTEALVLIRGHRHRGRPPRFDQINAYAAGSPTHVVNHEALAVREVAGQGVVRLDRRDD